MSEKEFVTAGRWLRERWANCVARELGVEHIPDEVHGVDLRPSRRGDYGFKMALEMAEPGTKRARRSHRTPWQIAEDYAAHGADACLWRNYCAGMRGAQMHHWSNGLRKAVRVAPEKTEQEIVEGEQLPEDELVAVLEPSAWAVVAARGAEGVLRLLDVAERPSSAAEVDSAIRLVIGCRSRGT
jgi:hypothetical protein